MWKGRWRLVVKRIPYLEKDTDGNYVQMVELVEHEIEKTVGRNRNDIELRQAPRHIDISM
jgi:hypothetical protein